MTLRARGSRKPHEGAALAHHADDPPLTLTQIRKLKRRVDDLKDPVRFILVSAMTPRFKLFYDVSNDTYVLNNPLGATLFKRRDAAEAVGRLLGGRVRVVRCRTRRTHGRRVPILTGALKPRYRP
jgi:hypothetical protein